MLLHSATQRESRISEISEHCEARTGGGSSDLSLKLWRSVHCCLEDGGCEGPPHENSSS